MRLTDVTAAQTTLSDDVRSGTQHDHSRHGRRTHQLRQLGDDDDDGDGDYLE